MIRGKLVKKIVCYIAVFMCAVFFSQMFCVTSYAKEEKRTEYKILVNRAANCVTVYEKDEHGEFNVPVKAFVCSVGREGHETPLGTFKTSDYYKWRLMVDGSYGRYAVRFNKGIMFHSVPYYSKNPADMEWEQYNLLGKPASLGCVRLACADAKWIYDNCRRGTEVVVYDDALNAGPLGKPSELNIAIENPYKKWDPTDMSTRNPWNTIRPSLYLKNNSGDDILRLPVGASLEDIYNAIGVNDAEGRSYNVGMYVIKFSGKYDLNTAGIYNVSVCGIGKFGVRAEQNMVLHVV